MREAWLFAARDLSIDFKSPFALQSSRTETIEVTGLLPQFGGENGAVIISRSDPDAAFDVADATGYYASALSPEFETYNRQSFIDALRSWGWNGADHSRPIWYLDARICATGSPCEACKHRDQTIDPAVCNQDTYCPACAFYHGLQ